MSARLGGVGVLIKNADTADAVSYIQVLHQQIRGGGGSKSVLIAQGVQNYGKHADIILERSLMVVESEWLFQVMNFVLRPSWTNLFS